MSKYPINPFKVEELRHEYARHKKYFQLINTYNKKLAEIEDLNTPELWDKLNRRKRLEKKENPMAYDRIKAVSELIQGEGIKVLNIGVGSGDLEHEVLQRNKDIEWNGIDISTSSVIEAKKNFPSNNFKKGSIRNLKFDNNYFNYVVILEVLEHIRPSKVLSALNEVYRVLLSKGKLIVSVPLNEGLEELIEKGENPNAHVRVYTPTLIEAELRISGFTVKWMKKLYAFHKNYLIKTFLAEYIIYGRIKPNNIILLSEKK